MRLAKVICKDKCRFLMEMMLVLGLEIFSIRIYMNILFKCFAKKLN